MHIRCPPGSYDANVEPAKDDVLFENAGELLRAAGMLFTKLYGEKEAESSAHSQRQSNGRVNTPKDGFQLLLARKAKSTASESSVLEKNLPNVAGQQQSLEEGMHPSVEIEPCSHPNTPLKPASLGDTVSRASSIGPQDDEEEAALIRNRRLHRRLDEEDSFGEDCRHVQLNQESVMSRGETEAEDLQHPDFRTSNPFIMARMNQPLQPFKRVVPQQRGSGDFPDASSLGFNHISDYGPVRPHGTTMGWNAGTLPSPARSQNTMSPGERANEQASQPWPFPQRPWKRKDQGQSGDKRRTTKERYGAGAMDTWVEKSMPNYSPADARNDSPDVSEESQQRSSEGFVRASEVFPNGPLMSPPASIPRRDRLNINRPFISPIQDQHRTSLDAIQPPSLQDRLSTTDRGGFRQTTLDLSDISNAELEEVMDFERRKKAVVQARKEQLRQQAKKAYLPQISLREDEDGLAELSSNSPHSNRYNAAVAALSQPTGGMDNASLAENEIGKGPIMSPTDPRAYLQRQKQQSSNGKPTLKLRRTLTKNLPLEKTPAGSATHMLYAELDHDLTSITALVHFYKEFDEYVEKGSIAQGALEDKIVVEELAIKAQELMLER